MAGSYFAPCVLAIYSRHLCFSGFLTSSSRGQLRQLEKLPAGWGIMCDDLAAGVYALLVVQLLLHWFR